MNAQPVSAALRPRVAVVFGGRSSEHEISCVTAAGVLAAIDAGEFEVVPIGITREGRWVRVDDHGAPTAAGAQLPSVSSDGVGLVLAGDPTVGVLLPLHDGMLAAGAALDAGLEAGPAALALPPVDVVFPVLHGPYGEDGTLQGLLELAGLPYVGSGVLASAVGMDKDYTKRLLAAVGLDVGDYLVITRRAWAAGPDAVRSAVAERLGWPVFVKPARAGSSMGISKVHGPDELIPAVEAARAHDPKVVVEAAVTGREIECGVLEGVGGAPPEASLPAEVRISTRFEFYDFEAKYLDDALALDIPPALDPEVITDIRRRAVAAFEALSCAGLARVDFFLRDDGRILVNEVNTMPGFTPMSAFPRMWEASGVSYPDLVRRLIRTALANGTGLR